MTVDDVFKVVARRGLRLMMAESGPILRGDKTKVSETLLVSLKRRKAEIAKRLIGELPRKREWLWRHGHTHLESEPDTEPHPIGAWWWRRQWDAEWQVVPGCEEHAKDCHPPIPLPKSQPATERKSEE